MTEHEIFLAALEIDDPLERAAYVAEACAGDAALEKQVGELLGAHERPGEFLDTPVLRQMAGRAADTRRIDPRHGDPESPREIDLSFLQPSTTPGSLGRLRHYEIREVIGRGACGIVLKGFDQGLHRVVAIKVMAPELAATSPARKRFLREARATAAIRHDNVVSIYAVEEDPLPFLVMEYIDGPTLQQHLDRTGPLELADLLRIGQQVARGLQAAHAQGLIHRDIKPANILLDQGLQRVKITDFGLARSADDASMTRSGVIAGTPLYMSPEQAQGEKVDQRTDLFSLGSVLYVMSSGRPPFRAETMVAVLKRVVDEQPRPIREIIPEVPEWLVDIIARLHAKDPAQRYRTADEVADLLGTCLEDLPRGFRVVLPAGSPAERESDAAATAIAARPAMKSGARRGRFSVTAVGVAVAIVAGIGLSEASGWTRMGATMIRLLSPHGTLVIEVDDPEVGVTVDGEGLVIRGAGVKELRLTPGQYQLKASKEGKVLRDELVTITRDGRQVVRVTRETLGVLPAPAAAPEPAAEAETAAAESRLKVPSRWIGTRTYRRGAYAESTVTYELRVTQRDGDTFTGVVFDNGPGRNRAEVEGEIDGTTLTWRERARGNVMTMRGELDGNELRLTFEGKYGNGTRNTGDGVLTRLVPAGGDLGPTVILDRGPWQGRYRLTDGVLTQTKAGTSMLLFGDRQWTDYDVSVETLTVSGDPKAQSGTLAFRSTDLLNRYELTIGNFSGTLTDLVMNKDGRWARVATPHWKAFERNRWYRLDVKLRGSRIVCHVDGEQVFDVEDRSFSRGMIGLGTWNSIVRWRNLRVTSPDGALLWTGFPKIPPEAQAGSPDREAAEFVLSIGGRVKIDDQQSYVTNASGLPQDPFQLTEVDLRENHRVTAADWGIFEETTHLKGLGLDNVPGVTDATIRHFRNNKALELFGTWGAQVSAASLALFRDSPHLHSIFLGESQFSDADMAFFGTFPALDQMTALFLTNTPVGDAGLEHLRGARRMIQLHLTGTRVTDAGLEVLASMPELNQLHLGRTAIGDAGLAHVHACRKLKGLDVQQTQVTAAGIEAFREAVPGCRVTWDGGVVEPVAE